MKADTLRFEELKNADTTYDLAKKLALDRKSRVVVFSSRRPILEFNAQGDCNEYPVEPLKASMAAILFYRDRRSTASLAVLKGYESRGGRL